jgi:hypothetical protein
VFRIRRKLRPRAPEKGTVRKDWHAELSPEKTFVYDQALLEVETAHAIYSVALDEAITLQKLGRCVLAREEAGVSADLCGRFAAALEGMLGTLEDHAKQFGTLPNAAPLNPGHFVGSTARHAASLNSMLSNVLFGERSRFLHKLRTLGEITSDLAIEYRMEAVQVSEGSAISSKSGWQHLGTLQFDLTTSLREATVVFKSFLVVLPRNEVASFKKCLMESLSAAPAVADRRAAAFRRE